MSICVFFYRIHYPLALPYCGPPDPAVLQETIRQLRVELEKTKKQVNISLAERTYVILYSLQAQQGQNHFAFARLQRE